MNAVEIEETVSDLVAQAFDGAEFPFLQVIDEIVSRIGDGSIVGTRYDPKKARLVPEES